MGRALFKGVKEVEDTSRKGYNRSKLLVNINFGHTAPMIILPYGAIAEINCDENKFRILEGGVK